MILARKSDGARFSGQIRSGGCICVQPATPFGVFGPFVALAPSVTAEHFRLIKASYVERLRLERFGCRIEGAA